MEDGWTGTTIGQHVCLKISGKAGIAKATKKVQVDDKELQVGDGVHFPELRGKKYWLWLKNAKIHIEESS
jgi:hypothetical protein